VNQTRPHYGLLFGAALAACSNAAPTNSTLANLGGNGATGGQSAGGSPAAFGGAQNNIGGSSEQGALSSIGGSAAVTTLGGTSAMGETIQSTGGSMGCDGTLTLGTVSSAQLSSELAQSHTFLLINVHVPVSGHIPGTDSDIDYRDIAAIETFIGADKSKPAVLYCMSEGMSRPAGTSLVTDGYCNIRILTGGLSAWRSEQYPVDP
jgi:rhodanese-related sulfurtransferase